MCVWYHLRSLMFGLFRKEIFSSSFLYDSLVSPHFYVCSMFDSTKRKKIEFIEGSANCTDARRERENENVLGEEERRSRPTKIRRNFTAVHHFCFTLQISQLFFFNDQRTRRNGEVEIDSGRKKISRHE